jgi:hypothetical protein
MTTIGTTSRPAYVYDAQTDTWIPVGVGPHSHDNYVDKALIDAKGDIFVGTAPDTVARLAVGVEGSVLVADPTAATGLTWGEAGGTIEVSATAPEDPTEGSVWYNSAEGTSYIYYDSFWVPLSPAQAGPEGATGAAGATGATGSSGVISVTAPITNSGTSTSANLGIDLANIAPIANPTFTGTVNGNPAAPANANSANAIGYIGLPQVILNSGNLTLNATHAGDHIHVTGASQTITIPANSSVPFEIGTTIVVINGNVTSSIAITSDTLRLAGGTTTGTRSLAVYGMATLVKISATQWIASGNGLT